MPRSSPITTGLARAWFPVALILLLLVALPGVALFVLNLLGLESRVNPWLQDHWRLSYHIPIPWWAGLVILLVPLFILLLYFLKLKRKPLHVPSTFLWKKSIEDLHVNSLLQWLRQNVLLLLQILTVLVLLYALMSFQVHGNMVEGRHYIIMVDNSASMSATDVSPNRLESAKKQALDEIDAHTDNDTGMLIVFNSSAETVQPYTHDRSMLRSKVKAIQPTQRPTRLEEALILAAGLANPARSTDDAASRPAGEDPAKARTYVASEGIPTEVYLFSDGRFPDVSDFNLGNLSVEYRPVGEPGETAGDNVGLVTLSATRMEAGAGSRLTDAGLTSLRAAGVPEPVVTKLGALKDKEPTTRREFAATLAKTLSKEEMERYGELVANLADMSGLLVFAQVANYRSVEARVRLDLEVYVNGEQQPRDIYKPQNGDGEAIPGRKLVPIDEGKPDGPKREQINRGTYTFVVRDVDDHSDVVMRARLKDNKDKFPLDDEAWLVVGVVRKARVLVVGPGNKLLSAFFDHPATQKVATVTYLEPGALKDAHKYLNPAREGAWDLVVFDRCAPETEEEMPSANTWFIDDVPPPLKKSKIVADKANVLDNPPVKGWQEKNSLMRYLSGLHEIGIASAFRVDPKDLPSRTPRLLESDRDTALLFTLSRQSYTDLVQTFAIMDNDGKFNTLWPLQASFPLFLRNVTYVLGNVGDAAGEDRVQPGEVKTLRPDMAVKSIEVFGPGKGGLPDAAGKGHPLERKGRPDFSFGDTDKVGVYEVRWDGKPQRDFAVNLLDSDESNIEPRMEIQIGQDSIKASRSHGTPYDTWKWVALAALGLLLLEWYVYNRRVYI